jgi:hypothetical protein
VGLADVPGLAWIEVTALVSRNATWSESLTRPIAARIPVRLRKPAFVAIRAVHKLAFLSISALIGLFAWDGIHRQPRRRTALAGTVAIAESAIYGSNNRVCPLTPMAEELGATSGTVTDIFLPDAINRRIPLVGGSFLVLGIILNLRALFERRAGRAATPATN